MQLFKYNILVIFLQSWNSAIEDTGVNWYFNCTSIVSNKLNKKEKLEEVFSFGNSQ